MSDFDIADWFFALSVSLMVGLAGLAVFSAPQDRHLDSVKKAAVIKELTGKDIAPEDVRFVEIVVGGGR